MSTWTAEELSELARIGEIRVAGRRQDQSMRTLTIVWAHAQRAGSPA